MATSFFMPITGAVNIAGRGLTLTGTISAGTVNKGDIVHLSTGVMCCVKDIYSQNKLRPRAGEGEDVVLLVKGEGVKLNAQDIPQGAFLSGDGIAYAEAVSETEMADDEVVYDID